LGFGLFLYIWEQQQVNFKEAMTINHIAKDFFESINYRTRSLVLGLAVCTAAAVLYLISPYDSGVYARCPFNALTDLYCPGCGTLRGVHELLHGRIGSAMGLNPLMVLLLPFIAYSFIKYVAAGMRERPERNIFIPSVFIWALLGIIVLFWILRNLPYYPFTLLAP
jgi:hypothetical protein